MWEDVNYKCKYKFGCSTINLWAARKESKEKIMIFQHPETNHLAVPPHVPVTSRVLTPHVKGNRGKVGQNNFRFIGWEKENKHPLKCYFTTRLVCCLTKAVLKAPNYINWCNSIKFDNLDFFYTFILKDIINFKIILNKFILPIH